MACVWLPAMSLFSQTSQRKAILMAWRHRKAWLFPDMQASLCQRLDKPSGWKAGGRAAPAY